MVPRLVFGMIDIGCAITFILVSLPLVYRKIPMNMFYGFRLPKAFKSDELWYTINEYGGRQLITWSVFLIVTGLVKFCLPIEDIDEPWGLPLMVGPILVASSVPIIRTLIFTSRL